MGEVREAVGVSRAALYRYPRPDGTPREESARAPKDPLLLALVAREFENEIYFVGPRSSSRGWSSGPLASIARLLGYRPEYPYPYARQSKVSRTVM